MQNVEATCKNRSESSSSEYVEVLQAHNNSVLTYLSTFTLCVAVLLYVLEQQQFLHILTRNNRQCLSDADLQTFVARDAVIRCPFCDLVYPGNGAEESATSQKALREHFCGEHVPANTDTGFQVGEDICSISLCRVTILL